MPQHTRWQFFGKSDTLAWLAGVHAPMMQNPLQAPPRIAEPGVTGLVFDIKRYALHDGPGIRTTVFLKGCALRCWWCHNPESQLPHQELSTKQLHLGEFCLTEDVSIGREMSASDVLAEVERDRVFYDESGGGVTFSGGEPLIQPEFLKQLLIETERRGIHRALDTCGFAPQSTLADVAEHVDLFLYDLKLMDEQAHKQYTGVSNQLILDNLEYLLRSGANIVIRFPLIPGITDSAQNLESLRSFLDERPALSRLDILPYHQTARTKYDRLNRENRARDISPPPAGAMKQVKNFFERNDRIVRIGG